MATWNTLTSQEQFDTLKAMDKYGGGFASALAKAWSRADQTNSARLGQAFDDLVKRYGPGSAFFERVAA
jgi:hypothetical protein